MLILNFILKGQHVFTGVILSRFVLRAKKDGGKGEAAFFKQGGVKKTTLRDEWVPISCFHLIFFVVALRGSSKVQIYCRCNIYQ